jgi:apolipoprotein N-acyltransferase
MGTGVLAALASAAALVLAFPKFSIFPLAWVALVPYLHWLAGRRTWKQVLAVHSLFGFVFFAGILYWIPRVLVVFGGLPWWIGVLALVLMTLILTLLILPVSLLTALTARRSVVAAVLTASGVWTLVEIGRNEIPFGGFPWAALGYTQAEFPWLIQVADLGSVYLVSYLIVLVNGGILLLLRRQAFPVLFGIMVVFLGSAGYGAWRVHFWVPETGDAVKVGIAQANIDLKSDLEYYADRYFRVLPRLFDQAVARGARWVLFPEAQNPYRLERDFYFRQFWQSRLGVSGAFLLLNSTAMAEEGYYNSAYLLDPSGTPIYRYDKIRLVPFGEYLPLKGLWGSGEALVAEVSSFLPGSEISVAEAAGASFATLICYEAIFPDLARAGANRGAEVLVNLTNDGWFGDSAAPHQHLQMARVRAVETRRPLLRAANSGFSAVVDPMGRIEQRTGLFTEEVLVAEVRGSRIETLYLRFGLVPTLLVIMLGMVLGLISPRAEAKGAKRGRRS